MSYNLVASMKTRYPILSIEEVPTAQTVVLSAVIIHYGQPHINPAIAHVSCAPQRLPSPSSSSLSPFISQFRKKSLLLHRDNSPKSYFSTDHGVYQHLHQYNKIKVYQTRRRRFLLKASFAFSSGNVSTIDWIPSSSVKAMASSMSLWWPAGQTWSERPFLSYAGG